MVLLMADASHTSTLYRGQAAVELLASAVFQLASSMSKPVDVARRSTLLLLHCAGVH